MLIDLFEQPDIHRCDPLSHRNTVSGRTVKSGLDQSTWIGSLAPDNGELPC
jgi:hypothetical protein